MMTRDDHLSSEQLEAYVLGMLAPAEGARVERHASGCVACERRLQKEAALEVALAAVVSDATTRSPRIRTASLSAFAGAAVAMAAATLLWLAPSTSAEPTSSNPPPNAPPNALTAPEISADASAATARLDLLADGSRVGVRD